MKADWIDPLLYWNLIQPVGGLVMYHNTDGGAAAHDDDYDFYTLYTDVYSNAQYAQPRNFHYPDPTQYETLHPPTLASLCRWTHASMRGGATFDLQELLALASPYEEASRLLGRLLLAHYDATSAAMNGLIASDEDVDDDMAEADWPDDVRCQRAVHHEYYGVSHDTLEHMAQQYNMERIAAAVAAWENRMAQMPPRKQEEHSEQQEQQEQQEPE